MTIIVTLAVSVFVLLLVGFAALYRAQRDSVDGYENEKGFHFGKEIPSPSRVPEGASLLHFDSDRAA